MSSGTFFPPKQNAGTAADLSCHTELFPVVHSQIRRKTRLFVTEVIHKTRHLCNRNIRTIFYGAEVASQETVSICLQG
jgi:hypothetical protein